MQKIPLITSIPPNLSRQDFNFKETGKDYRIRCVESWLKSGFQPISVNTQREIKNNIDDKNGVIYKFVGRDAFSSIGKPLVFINDMLHVAEEVSDGPVVIMNADILLDITRPIYNMIQCLQPGKCIIAKRIDIDTVENRDGVEFIYGYDFFVFHSNDLHKYTDSEFVFGVPWWDHHFPISMVLRGIDVIPISNHFAFHLIHNERWDTKLWLEYGNKFMGAINADLATYVNNDKFSIKKYSEAVKRALELSALKLFKFQIVVLTEAFKRALELSALKLFKLQIAALTKAFKRALELGALKLFKSLIIALTSEQSIKQRKLISQLHLLAKANVNFLDGLRSQIAPFK